MKRWYRIIILAVAAIAGTVYYNRYHALTNLAQPSSSNSYNTYRNSPIGDVGGLGKVGGAEPPFTRNNSGR